MLRVMDQNTEEFLLSELKEQWGHDPTRRCLYMRSSQLEQQKQEWLPALESAIREKLDDDIKIIYMCYDGDVFILSRSLTHKRVNQFLSHLIPTLSPAPLSPGLASLFEVGIHWGRLQALIEKKIEQKNRLLSPQKYNKIELDMVTRESLLNGIDSELIRSVSERRLERQSSEILIVEDDPFSRKLVQNTLKEGYSLSSTADGKGAVLNYVTKAPDVLFLDIGLPDMTGHEVLDKIFDMDPSAYVVMFSGNGDRENIMKAIERGAKGFVGKPFTRDKLIQYINKSPFIHAKRKESSYETYQH